jgi:hypothetical protein
MLCAAGDFFISKSSCHVRHSRFTLCGFHHTEGHVGDWKVCKACRQSFENEMYVYYGTNKYNFEKLKNPSAYKPTHCSDCGRLIVLSKDPYSRPPGGGYQCEACWKD